MNLSEKIGQKTCLTIITCKFDNKNKNSEYYKNYNIIRVKHPFYISSAIKAAKLKPDLIIFGTGISELWLLLATSIVFQCFNIIFSYSYSSRKPRYLLYQFVDLNYKNSFLAKYVCRIFEKVICTNNSLYRFYLKHNKKKEKGFYLPPGVDLLKFYNAKSEINKKIRIGFFGHLNYNKGSDILLNAFLKLNNDNIELFLAGLGNLEKGLKERSSKHKNIIIKGYIENIEQVIASCDLLVFPYRYSEKILGLSLSAIEGLAMGKPLIVSNNNCLRDLVEHGKNGYIFNNEKELINYLKEITKNRNNIIKFGLESEKKSREFDISMICDKLINLFLKNESRK
ncbi:MAG: glycosyltransferase [Patescibacteria group bacterium]|nr:glycosyltransferase [Patescibacteria group bacterium]